MNTDSIRSRLSRGRHAASRAAILGALFVTLPVCTVADPRAATGAASAVAEVSLTGLDLSTPEGMRLAGERLRSAAERLCGNRDGGREPASQSAFGACVDSTVANELRHIEKLRQAHVTVLNSVTLGASVSLADLDLTTLEGAGIAHQRLEATARRLCGELARRQDISYQPNYAGCVRETLAGALAQADALAAARNTRTAQRTTP